MRSLRMRLFGLWLLSLAAGVAIAVVLLQLYQQSAEAQVARAQVAIAHACELIEDRYVANGAGQSNLDLHDPEARAALTALVTQALERQNGVEGGIWQVSTGSIAYAFPTYEGTGPKTDLPAAEEPRIEKLNQQSARDRRPADYRLTSRGQTLLIHARPLPGPVQGLTAWTMTRVATAPGFRPLVTGLAMLFALVIAMAVWLGRTLLVWGRHVRGIEAALAAAGSAGMPRVSLTGEQELDRIIGALNDAGQRLAAAQREAETLTERAQRAERLAALGRVAAGVAHEIRNPIAAAKLQGENALAGDDSRRREAISDMLQQMLRLETLASELLAMTQREKPRLVEVALADFIAGCVARHAVQAADRCIGISTPHVEGAVRLDPVIVGRVLDNLLTNAIRHAPEGGKITLSLERTESALTFIVADSGAGVSPSLTGRLFEPFVTGRPDGTGLGLAIARELADAHGGRLTLREPGGAALGHGATFVLEIPVWPPS